MSASLTPDEDACVRRLLAKAGLETTFRSIRLSGGANNRVYRVESGRQTALLKVYFTSPNDPRDRLEAEFAFAEFLHRHGIAAGPHALACDRDAGMALYEYLDGRRLAPQEVGPRHVEAAIDFVREINRNRTSPDARALPAASEACFSMEEHVACVERRVERLKAIGNTPSSHAAAREFIARELWPRAERVAASVRRHAETGGYSLSSTLSPEERCLSPSDFGFHNALDDAQGRLRFFDFEYAGWDDAAKLVCDFFCQVEAPAPAECWESFVGALAGEFPASLELRRRSEWLLPLYRLKWCCILLNEFLPAHSQRRQFSRGVLGEDRKMVQLDKAREALARLE